MYEIEIEKYVVCYGESFERTFNEVENAIDFAREKMDEGIDSTIKQIDILVGWY